jgi:uncharacterized membrane protein
VAFAEIERGGRLPGIDIARGVAILAMALYHFAWDLSFYRLISVNVGLDPAWQWVARVIAGSFLALVGVGLVLAHGEGVRWRAFLRRLALIGGAALLITAATFVAFPESYIFFGILHCIALSSVLALPFLRAPAPAIGLAMVACFAAPWVLTQPAFDWPPLAFLGLGEHSPTANDYVPLFPWFALVLAGMLLGRAIRRRRLRGAGWLGRPAKGALRRSLAWAGRRSLLIYLVHQPILLALLYPVALALGPNPAAEAAPFLRAHEAACVRTGEPAEICRRVGSCLVEELRAEGLWAAVVSDRLPAGERQRVIDLSRACHARAKVGPAPGG